MTVEAARPFRFAGVDLLPGDRVTGAAGETPSGRVFSALLRTGKIIVRDNDTGGLPPAAQTRTEHVARRQTPQAKTKGQGKA